MKKAIYFLSSLLLCCSGLCGCSDDADEAVAATMPPKLISIIPKAGASGTAAVISGLYFSENPSENTVTINGKAAEVTASSNNRIVITLPDNPDGTYSIKVGVNGRETEGLKFTYAPGYLPELSVLQCMPSMAYVGDEIKIIGQCFSTVAAENKVTINGAEAVVKEASETMLTIVVPENAEGTYPVSVTVGGKTATGSAFTYGHLVRLTAVSVTPDKGKAGNEVVITGEGFGATPADNKVTINGVEAKVKSVAQTSMTIVVPENPAGTYPVVITVDDKTVDNLQFTYVDDPWSVTTIAGDGTASIAAGKGLSAAIAAPQGIAMAADGSLWICSQTKKALLRMDKDLNVSVVSVKGANLDAPWGCAFGNDGKLYMASKANHQVLRVAADGAATQMLSADDWKGPMGVASDADGAIYVSDRDAKKIRKIATDGKITDYDMSDCKQGPCATVVDSKGRIYAVNGADYKVFMFEPDGTRSVILGTGAKPTADTWTDGEPGKPLTASMGQSFGITIASDGTMYICDLLAFVVRAVTPDANGDYANGTVRTIAGVPFTGGKLDGVGTVATFKSLGGIVAYGDKLYVADNGNNLIRVISK